MNNNKKGHVKKVISPPTNRFLRRPSQPFYLFFYVNLVYFAENKLSNGELPVCATCVKKILIAV